MIFMFAACSNEDDFRPPEQEFEVGVGTQHSSSSKTPINTTNGVSTGFTTSGSTGFTTSGSTGFTTTSSSSGSATGGSTGITSGGTGSTPAIDITITGKVEIAESNINFECQKTVTVR